MLYSSFFHELLIKHQFCVWFVVTRAHTVLFCFKACTQNTARNIQQNKKKNEPPMKKRMEKTHLVL